MRNRIFIAKENAGDDMELMVPAPPEAAYGKWVHCGTCSTRLVDLDPRDPWCQCNMCGNITDISDYLKDTEDQPLPA